MLKAYLYCFFWQIPLQFVNHFLGLNPTLWLFNTYFQSKNNVFGEINKKKESKCRTRTNKMIAKIVLSF